MLSILGIVVQVSRALYKITSALLVLIGLATGRKQYV